MSWLAVAWKRRNSRACREETLPAVNGVQYTPRSCTAVLVACSEDKKGRKSTLDPRQYANMAIKRDALFLLPAFNYLPLSLYFVRCRYKQAHNVGAKMSTDGIPVPLPRRPHALAHPEPLMKPPTMLAFIGFHRFSSVSRSAWYVRAAPRLGVHESRRCKAACNKRRSHEKGPRDRYIH